MRDYQRKKVYTAEKQWDNPLADETDEWLDKNLYPYSYPYDDAPYIKNVLPFYQALEDHEVAFWVAEMSYSWDIEVPHINFQDNQRKVASANIDYINLPGWAMNFPSVCHEMAHIITQQKCVFDGHGPIFCAVFIELVHDFMGAENARDLQWAFEANSVDVEYNTIDDFKDYDYIKLM